MIGAFGIDGELQRRDREAFQNLQRWRDSGFQYDLFDSAMWDRMLALLRAEIDLARACAADLRRGTIKT